MKKTITGLFLLITATVFLAACGGGTSPTGDAAATEIPIAIADTGVVVDGMLVPRETVELSFNVSGRVAEVLVEEGDVVSAGDVIAQLGDRERLESNIANAEQEKFAAEQELLNAQQALKQLNDNLPEDRTAALRAVTDARDALDDAEREYRAIYTPASQADIAEAQANLILAEDRLEKARKDYEPYENKREDNIIRAGLLNKLADAQRNYDNALRRYNAYTGIFTSEFNQMQAEAELEIAQQRLEQAQNDYEDLSEGPDPDDVAAIDARIASAESRISAASAAITAAQADLEDLDLIATIDGTVVSLDLIAGQTVSPGTPVVSLADFSQWYVDTDNLTEIEVVDVGVGESASIVADALPELEMTGVVEKINDQFEEKRGDITYTARLRVRDVDPRLRWGMTVVVSFDQ